MLDYFFIALTVVAFLLIVLSLLSHAFYKRNLPADATRPARAAVTGQRFAAGSTDAAVAIDIREGYLVTQPDGLDAVAIKIHSFSGGDSANPDTASGVDSGGGSVRSGGSSSTRGRSSASFSSRVAAFDWRAVLQLPPRPILPPV